MLSRIADWIGNIWGRASTILLAVGMAILPILQGIDRSFTSEHPVITWAIIIIGVTVAVLRVIAPPPPAVPIKRGDAVSVDHDAGTIVVTKSEPIPATLMNKLPGQKA
jgi:hypothetical protein